MFRTRAGTVKPSRTNSPKGVPKMADETQNTTQDGANTTDHSPEAAQVGTSDGDGDSEKSE